MAFVKHTLREDRFMWTIRLLQFLIMLIELGVAGKAASIWVNDIGCQCPARVAWNVACACLTLFLLLYLIPTTGPLSWTPIWNRWVQIGLDAIFVIFWIAAAATSTPDCNDLCSACSVYDVNGLWYVWSGNVQCTCFNTVGKRGLLDARTSAAGEVAETAGEIIAKQGLGGGLVFLFIVTLVYGIWKNHEERTAANSPEADHLNAQQNAGKIGEVVSEIPV